MIDTAGTLTQAAAALREAAPATWSRTRCTRCCRGPAIERLAASNIAEVVVTNTVQLRDNALACKKITSLSVAKIFGEAIRRIHSADSLSSLFV